MPIPIIKDKISLLSEGITLEEIQQLVTNYRTNFRKTNAAGNAMELDPYVDSRCVSFTMEEVQQLFLLNGYKPDMKGYELRVYFGSHAKDEKNLRDMGVPEDKIQIYLGQQTAILVVAEPNLADPKNTPKDCLNPKQAVIIGGIDVNQGLEVGTLCPPACNGHLIY